MTVTRTHPLLFPLSARAKRGNCFSYVILTPPLYKVERGMGGEYMQNKFRIKGDRG